MNFFCAEQILGLKQNYEKNDITQAYRKLAKIYHPDKSTGNASKFIEIKEAHDFLQKNFEKKKTYKPAPTMARDDYDRFASNLSGDEDE